MTCANSGRTECLFVRRRFSDLGRGESTPLRPRNAETAVEVCHGESVRAEQTFGSAKHAGHRPAAVARPMSHHAPHVPHVPHENHTGQTAEHGRRRPLRGGRAPLADGWPRSEGSPYCSYSAIFPTKTRCRKVGCMGDSICFEPDCQPIHATGQATMVTPRHRRTVAVRCTSPLPDNTMRAFEPQRAHSCEISPVTYGW